MLSFELSPGWKLTIYFDLAGRDFLLSESAGITDPGDHTHLFGPKGAPNHDWPSG